MVHTSLTHGSRGLLRKAHDECRNPTERSGIFQITIGPISLRLCCLMLLSRFKSPCAFIRFFGCRAKGWRFSQVPFRNVRFFSSWNWKPIEEDNLQIRSDAGDEVVSVWEAGFLWAVRANSCSVWKYERLWHHHKSGTQLCSVNGCECDSVKVRASKKYDQSFQLICNGYFAFTHISHFSFRSGLMEAWSCVLLAWWNKAQTGDKGNIGVLRMESLPCFSNNWFSPVTFIGTRATEKKHKM